MNHVSTLVAREQPCGVSGASVWPLLSPSPREDSPPQPTAPLSRLFISNPPSSSSKHAGEQVLAACWAPGTPRWGLPQCLPSESPVMPTDV